MFKIIVLPILIQVLFSNSIYCQTTVNDSVILSGSLHHLNQSLIIQLIISGQNFTEESTTSSENTSVSEVTTNVSQNTTQTTSTQTGVSSESTTTQSTSSQTNATNSTSSSNSSAIISTESTPVAETTSAPTTGNTTPMNTTSSESQSTTEQMTTMTTSSSMAGITTTVMTGSTVPEVGPIVLSTTEPSSSISVVPNSSPGNIQGSTLPNMYPQDVRYSCPRAVNGCKGPTSCLYQHPDCSKFFHCNDGGQAFVMDCPTGLEWNDEQKICDLPENAGCSSSP